MVVASREVELLGEVGNLLPQLAGVSSSGRMTRIAEAIGPHLGKEPYCSREFELGSPIGNEAKDRIIQWMVGLLNDEGRELFRSSPTLDMLSANEASHKALELMYVGPLAEESGIERMWTRFAIENTHTAMAVRNRLRIVKETLFGHINACIEEGREQINVLGIASGSSRGLIEVAGEHKVDNVKIRSVDISRTALQDTEALARSCGIRSQVETQRASFLNTSAYLSGETLYDFVEIVGLLDYFEDDQIKVLLKAVKGSLRSKGMVIYSNVTHNSEEQYTHGVVGWRKLFYRDEDEIFDLALTADFKRGKTRLIREPLGMCNLVVVTN